jgi:adenylyltransferase/sulfurtransferase
MLSPTERVRYDRQLRLAEIGHEGQAKLKSASILVVGAGGLGCPVLQYLAAAGVGEIGIADFDVVDESNLQRQILYGTEDLGINKAEAAKKHLYSLNPLISVQGFTDRMTSQNTLDIMEPFDLILDCSDNFATRYLINDASLILNKPFVYGAIYKFEGQVAVFNYQNGPSYRCLFPNPPSKHIPNCAEIGVLGVLPGIIGSLQANEALKIILEIGNPLSGELLVYNTLSNQVTRLGITRNEHVISKVKDAAKTFEEGNYDDYCKLEENNMREVSLETFNDILSKGSMKILDVREPWETPRIEGQNVLYIPVSQVLQSLDQIPRDEDVIVACQHGVRSRSVVEYLTNNHQFTNLINLQGGLTPNE